MCLCVAYRRVGGGIGGRVRACVCVCVRVCVCARACSSAEHLDSDAKSGRCWLVRQAKLCVRRKNPGETTKHHSVGTAAGEQRRSQHPHSMATFRPDSYPECLDKSDSSAQTHARGASKHPSGLAPVYLRPCPSVSQALP